MDITKINFKKLKDIRLNGTTFINEREVKKLKKQLKKLKEDIVNGKADS